jgi:hypothetical protein
MKHTEHAYIEAGYRYAKARNEYERLQRARLIRSMISEEIDEDKTHARRLVERGRTEA